MKFIIAVFFVLLAVSFTTHAQEMASPTPAVVVAPAPSPVAAPVVAPAPVVENTTSTTGPKLEVAEPAAPPAWAESVIMAAQKLPVVGPIVTKILVYAGIISSIMTALIACLLTVLSALKAVLNLAGLASFADKVAIFKDGKIMYWLKYLSMFNAKKPETTQKEATAA